MMASVEDTVSITDVNSRSRFMGTVISLSLRESSCWINVSDWMKSLYLEGKWTMHFGCLGARGKDEKGGAGQKGPANTHWVRLSLLTTSKFVFVLGTVKLSWMRVV